MILIYKGYIYTIYIALFFNFIHIINVNIMFKTIEIIRALVFSFLFNILFQKLLMYRYRLIKYKH